MLTRHIRNVCFEGITIICRIMYASLDLTKRFFLTIECKNIGDQITVTYCQIAIFTTVLNRMRQRLLHSVIFNDTDVLHNPTRYILLHNKCHRPFIFRPLYLYPCWTPFGLLSVLCRTVLNHSLRASTPARESRLAFYPCVWISITWSDLLFIGYCLL